MRYTLGVVAAAYRNFSTRVQALAASDMSKPDRIREIIKGTLGKITKAEIIEQCPDISQITAHPGGPSKKRGNSEAWRRTLHLVYMES